MCLLYSMETGFGGFGDEMLLYFNRTGEGSMKMYFPYSLKSTIFPEGNARGDYDTRGRLHFHTS
jgi:hypothetical protein